MSATTDVSSVTTSVLLAMEKEFRKNGMAPAFHRHYKGNRQLIEAMVAMIAADALNNELKPKDRE